MPSTYEPIATNTLGSDTSTVTFSSIPSTYTDLRIVASVRVASASIDYFSMRLNSDTAANYSLTYLQGFGLTASSSRFSSLSQGIIGWATSNTEPANQFNFLTVDLMNYSNSTTNKTYLTRSNDATNRVYSEVGLYRSTSAISSIVFGTWGAGTFGANNIKAGSTFTLYGIKAA